MKLIEYRVSEIMTLARRPVDVAPDGTYHEIGLRSFGNGVFHKPPVSGEELGLKRVFHIEPGDLVFSNVFAWEGAVALASEEEAGRIGSHRFMTYRVNTEITDRRYLLYYFYGGPGLEVVRDASPGSAGRNRTLGISTFERQRVRLPTVDEQRRIADKLDSSLGCLSAVESLRTRVLDLQSNLRESLIHHAISEHTSLARVSDILTFTRTEVEIKPDELYKAIGMRSFGKGMIRYAPTRGDELSKLRYFSFPQNALALSNIKAWEGAISVTSEAEAGYVASNRFLFYVPIDDRANVSYLRHYFLSRPGLAQVCAKSPGGADRNRTLGIRGFEAIGLPLPPRRVQDRVASTLDRLSARIQAAYEKRSLSALRPALLDAAFSGRL
ncbi:MAG TPA: hypothetical protein VFM55_11010 [Micromonosporaceae bacterium]|nr:hypothetical protein [Micromonosporaceae bacterium]